jgi:hypothetical protein
MTGQVAIVTGGARGVELDEEAGRTPFRSTNRSNRRVT